MGRRPAPQDERTRRDAARAHTRVDVLLADEVQDRRSAGGKAFALSVVRERIPEVPDWFVIRPEAFARCASPECTASVAAGQPTLDALLVDDALQREIEEGLRRICPDGEPVAVRSSAVEEDSAAASFAGQLESFLDVSHDEVARRVADVWRSGFSPRVRRYREEQGLAGDPQPPAVLVQRMVRADVSGVAFSRDPVGEQQDACVVCATSGLGEGLVGGLVDGDTFHVVGDEIITDRVSSDQAVLSQAQVRAVAALARRAEAAFGCPQDIEWAICGAQLQLLQSRPITTLGATPAGDEAGDVVLWDNSNIVESYSGVTSPLTFSFARRVYAAVYRQFGVHLGVRHSVIARHADVLGNLLGRIRGRVYYNLLNWYRVLALLPGFDLNRRYLDQMLGVRGRVPADVLDSLRPPQPHGIRRLRAAGAWTRTVCAIAGNWLFLERRMTRFYERVERALATSLSDIESMRLEQLVAQYRGLERSLLERWDAPVLNDFYCMIFFGVSRHALRTWGHGDGRGLHGEYMQHQGRIVSTEPAQRIRAMADLAAGDPDLCAALVDGDWRAALAAHDELRAAFDSYLAKFGDRCVQELKLESATLYDDPSLLVRTVGHLAGHAGGAPASAAHRDPRRALRTLMTGRPLRRLAAGWLLRNARRHVRHRENLRFERTRIFGRVRRIFIEIGRRLTEAGVLAEPGHVFYLELPELLAAAEGALTVDDLGALARLRLADSDRCRSEPDPPNRFITRGAVITASFEALATARRTDVDPADDAADERRGLGCSPGIAVGPARVIADPQGQTLQPGEILVARHTDPGWVLLFAGAAGIVVERGSLLSHSAIVARELGIPAVVSLPGVTTWLQDGDRVELDGTHGVVRRIADD